MIFTAILVAAACVLLAAYALRGRRFTERSVEADKEVFRALKAFEDAVCQEESPEDPAQTRALASRLMEAIYDGEVLNQELESHFSGFWEIVKWFAVMCLFLAAVLFF